MSKKKKKHKKPPIPSPPYTFESNGTLILGPLTPGTWELRKVA